MAAFHHPAWRWFALACVAFLEASFVTSRFDIAALERSHAGWARLLTGTPVLFPCSLAIVTAVILFGRDTFLAAVTRTGTRPDRSLTTLAIVHALAFGGFLWLTRELFQVPTHVLGGWCLAIAWVIVGLATLSTLALSALPMATWRGVFGRGGTSLALGLGVGVLAWSAANQAGHVFWHPFGDTTISTVHGLLEWFTGKAVLDPSAFVTGTDRFTVRVGIGCSGYEGIGLASVLVGTYLWIARERLRFPFALVLFPLAVTSMWTLNVVRITGLILIGHAGFPDLALGSFHSRVGWILFCVVSLALIALAERSRILRSERPKASSCIDPSVLCWPFLALVGTQFVGGAIAPDTAELHALALLLAVALVWRNRTAYARLDVRLFVPTRAMAGALFAGALVAVVWASAEGGVRSAFAREDFLLASDSTAAFVEPLGLGLTIAGSVLIVPIVEELAFRVYLLERLRRVWGARAHALPWIGSSVLFGLAHQDVVLATLAGLIYGAIALRRGLPQAIAAHAVTNALLLAVNA